MGRGDVEEYDRKEQGTFTPRIKNRTKTASHANTAAFVYGLAKQRGGLSSDIGKQSGAARRSKRVQVRVVNLEA